jgi:plasmid stabilization system protein ParE
MVEIRWTQEAVSDLERLHHYYAEVAPAFSGAIIQRLFDSVAVLEQHHRIGRKVPEIGRDNFRELIVSDH